MRDERFDEQRGKLKDFGGQMERGAGDLLGDDELRAKGTQHEAEGKAQNIFGKAKNTLGNASDKVKDAIDPNSKDPMVDKDYQPRRDETNYRQ